MSATPTPLTTPLTTDPTLQPPIQRAATGGAGVWAWRIAGVGFVALLVIAGAFAVLTQFFVREQRTSDTYTDPVTTLSVTTGEGRIHVVSSGSYGDPTRVVITRHSAFRLTRVSQEQVGRELTVQGRCTGLWPFSDPCRVDVDVLLPRGAKLVLRSDTGEVMVTGVDGDVDAYTSTGAVRLAGVTSRIVTARADTGAVVLQFAAPPTRVVASADTGAVLVTVPADGTEYAVKTRSDVGPARVRVPVDPTSGHKIDATTSDGPIVVQTGS